MQETEPTSVINEVGVSVQEISPIVEENEAGLNEKVVTPHDGQIHKVVRKEDDAVVRAVVDAEIEKAIQW